MERGLRFADGWPKWASAFLFLAVGAGCDEKKSPEPAPNLDERPLLDPEEPAREFSHRCTPAPGNQPVTLRAVRSKKVPGVLEIGSVAAVPGGFVAGVLRTESETYAEVVFFDGKGASKTTRLSRVHGAVDAPKVLSFGADAIVVVPDNDAGHTRLRLAQVKSPAKNSEVSWGPEIQVRRGESQAFSAAISSPGAGEKPSSAVVVWDDFDKGTLRSQVRALVFHPATMKVIGGEKALTAPEEDATEPLVVGGEPGTSSWLVWLAYQPDPEAVPSGTLVQEPPRVLRVQKLDASAQPEGEPLTVSEGGDNVLAFDAMLLKDGSLSLAYRGAESGRSEGASPVFVRVVDAGGGIASGMVAHEELGLGAPALLSSGDRQTVWLSARATDSDVLLGRLGASAAVEKFSLEAGLRNRIPLAGSGSALLVMEPDGLDLRFSTVACRP